MRQTLARRAGSLILIQVFCLLAGQVLAGIEADGPKLSPDVARDLFVKVCVRTDTRTTAPLAAAKKIGFRKDSSGHLYNPDINAEVQLVSVNKAGICQLIFVPSNSEDDAYSRAIGRIEGMKKGRHGFLLNGNGQRSAFFARLPPPVPETARAFVMVVGADAETFD